MFREKFRVVKVERGYTVISGFTKDGNTQHLPNSKVRVHLASVSGDMDLYIDPKETGCQFDLDTEFYVDFIQVEENNNE